MIKVFLTEKIDNVPIIELLRPNLNISYQNRFTERYPILNQPVVSIVQDIVDADYIIIPHNYNYIRANREYLSHCQNLINLNNKKCIVFFPGDDDAPVKMRDTIVFRNSKYKGDLLGNEFIIPAYSPDLGTKYGFEILPRSDKPSISFCGWTRFDSKMSAIKAFIKYMIARVEAMFYRRLIYRIKGLWLRRRALKILKKHSGIDNRFIERDSYSGNEKTIKIDTKRAEEEFVQNMKSSLFALCIKGNGNFSARFYEALSLARIPIFIDTDCVLPLSNIINYDDFIIKIDLKEIKSLSDIVIKSFSNMTEADINRKQNLAREIYTKYLRIDSFFEYIFDEAIWSNYIDITYAVNKR